MNPNATKTRPISFTSFAHDSQWRDRAPTQRPLQWRCGARQTSPLCARLALDWPESAQTVSRRGTPGAVEVKEVRHLPVSRCAATGADVAQPAGDEAGLWEHSPICKHS